MIPYLILHLVSFNDDDAGKYEVAGVLDRVNPALKDISIISLLTYCIWEINLNSDTKIPLLLKQGKVISHKSLSTGV